MRKLQLNPDDLRVESFATVAFGNGGAGTVRAQAYSNDFECGDEFAQILIKYTENAIDCFQLPMPTQNATCAYSCQQSCWGTCDYSCGGTCGQTTCYGDSCVCWTDPPYC